MPSFIILRERRIGFVRSYKNLDQLELEFNHAADDFVAVLEVFPGLDLFAVQDDGIRIAEVLNGIHLPEE